MRSMIKTFGGVNFDEMTLAEYVQFVDAWALTPYGHTDESKHTDSYDQTYLFRFFNQVGIPEKIQVELFIKTMETRLKVFIDFAKRDADKKSVSFEDDYNTDAAIRRRKYGKNKEGHAYLNKLRERISKEAPKVREFLRPLFFDYELSHNE